MYLEDAFQINCDGGGLRNPSEKRVSWNQGACLRKQPSHWGLQRGCREVMCVWWSSLGKLGWQTPVRGQSEGPRLMSEVKKNFTQRGIRALPLDVRGDPSGLWDILPSGSILICWTFGHQTASWRDAWWGLWGALNQLLTLGDWRLKVLAWAFRRGWN